MNKEGMLMRLITLMTLRTNLNSSVMKGTVELAVAAELGSSALPRRLGDALAPLVSAAILEQIKGERANLLRTVINLDADPTPGCDCAGCRVIRWAKEVDGGAPKEPSEEEKAKAAEMVREVLRAACKPE
jgi:hypothetical protein